MFYTKAYTLSESTHCPPEVSFSSTPQDVNKIIHFSSFNPFFIVNLAEMKRPSGTLLLGPFRQYYLFTGYSFYRSSIPFKALSK